MLHLLIVALLFIPYLNGIAIKEFNDKPAFSSNYLGIAQFDTFCDANATNALNGTLTTPNYPGNYSNNLDCYYYIYSPVAYNIHVLVDYFSTEACCDYFEISTSTTNSSWSTIAHLNGANGTVNLSYVLQNNARLLFRSDSSVVSNGIHLTWNSIPDYFSLCSSTNSEHYAQTGKLATPNFPSNYTSGLSCGTYLYAPLGYSIQLIIDYFSTEPNDRMTINTRNSSTSGWTGVEGLSGHNGTVNWNFTLQNYALLTFYSNSNTDGGIHLSWNSNPAFQISPPTSSNCQGYNILFLLDRSQSIFQNFYNIDIKTFIVNVTSRFGFVDDVNAENLYSTSFGVIEFSNNNAVLTIPLKNYTRYDFLSNMTQSVSYNGYEGTSSVVTALLLAYNVFSENGNGSVPNAIVLIVNDISPFSFNTTLNAMNRLKEIVDLPMGIIVPGINGIPTDAQQRLNNLIGNSENTFSSLQTAITGIPFLTSLNNHCSVCSGLIFIGEMSNAIGYNGKLRFLKLAQNLAAATAKRSSQRFAIALYGSGIYQSLQMQTFADFNQTITGLINTMQLQNTPDAGQTYLAPILNQLYTQLGSDISSSNHAVLLMGEISVIRDPNPAYVSAQNVANRNTDIYVLSEDRYHAPTDIWDTLTQNQQSHIINGTVYSGVGDLFSVIGPKLLPEFNNMNCQTR